MKKVFKYATGQEIPEGAIYLTTIVEEAIKHRKGCGKRIEYPNKLATGDICGEKDILCSKCKKQDVEKKIRLVWHYFLVEVDK